ncbi:DUF928 domain-containing protein [Calothrix sp. FACHB-1219]|uniref:DUF928 domain-containing protein n=1 Tax=unclassified Calothrix TaxID=2619626 RepID=UPI0016847D79|nr:MULTISPECIES: DUF928 domain-containing protein [unclassified Calothrix]MBD2207858.1 DUF928 domain-containing protein [Calothrix sp. FACHB-168]MBD2222458.1 DUF928 domain-containing protein [Calothrix sp. FACHB-1219]
MIKNYFISKKILFFVVLLILSAVNIILTTYFNISEIPTIAQGQTTNDVNGPSKRTSPRKPPNGNATRRGCSGITLMAPIFGQSISMYPNFFWFVSPEQSSNKEYQIEFSIYEYDAETGDKKGRYLQRITKTTQESLHGIMNVSLDKNKPGLIMEKQYIWQVTLICDETESSNSLIAQAVIETIPTPTNLEIQLSKTKNRLERVQLFTKENLWYEALNEISENKISSEYVKILEELRDDETQESIKVGDNKEFKEAFEKQASALQKVIEIQKNL